MERIKKVCRQLKADAYQALFITDPSNIRYLTGYRGDDAYLLLLDDGQVFLITDFRYLEQAQKDCRSDRNIAVIEHSPAKNPLEAVLLKLLKSYCPGSLAFEKEHISYALFEILNQAAAAKLLPISGLVGKYRRLKDQKELDSLRKATAIADLAFLDVIKSIAPGISEKQLEAKLVYSLLAHGAEKLSFPSIVASGPNGSLPHALPSDRLLQKGDLITFDFGAVYEGYHSDCTRTVMLGQPSAKQKAVYQLVKEAQESAAAILKAGLCGREAHLYAAAIIAEGGYDGYFNHGLGHGTGLDIHEAPTLNPKSDDILAAGNTVTCEPGVYLPKWGGVRIEDTLIIKEDGSEALGNITKDMIII